MATSDDLAHRLVDEVADALEPLADPEAAFAMAAYMKDRFVFLGIKTPVRRQETKRLLTRLAGTDAPTLLAFARGCWARPEREYQYVACDTLRKHAAALGPDDLDTVRGLIETRSWWDTVDSLAVHTVGPMVAAHPELAEQMDVWIDDDDIWVARTAILHQLMYKGDTDDERLFAYCDARAADTEFFIRKALGWALRQYARTDPEAVRAYVETNAELLSGLTKREALKHIA
ncbi:MAG: DNA alkylation repair protein [Actinomycetota bacterium]